MKRILQRRAKARTFTQHGLEVLLWGVACGRLSTAALTLSGLIGVLAAIGYSPLAWSDNAGLLVYFLLFPFLFGTVIVFGTLLVCAAVRGFRLLYLGRREFGAQHARFMGRAWFLFLGAAAAGAASAAVGVPTAMAFNMVWAPPGPAVTPRALAAAFVWSDLFALTSCGLAALALVEATRELAADSGKALRMPFLALAVAYPFVSLALEFVLVIGTPTSGATSDLAILTMISLPAVAILSYAALWCAGELLDYALLHTPPTTLRSTPAPSPAES